MITYRIGQLPRDFRDWEGDGSITCHPYLETNDETVWVLCFRASGGQLYLQDVLHASGERITVPEWLAHNMTDADMHELMVGWMRTCGKEEWHCVPE
jgi:hypothetical protein